MAKPVATKGMIMAHNVKMGVVRKPTTINPNHVVVDILDIAAILYLFFLIAYTGNKNKQPK